MTFPSLNSYSQNEITLSVQYPPSIFITTETPGIQNHTIVNHTTNQEVTVQEGSSLALKCSVDSNPGAQVTWMKGEKNVLNKGNGSELMLNLSNIIASEADTYHCLAHNNLGAINQTIIIIVQSDNTKYFVIAGAVGIAALLLVAVTLKLLLRSRTKNNKTEDSSVKNNQYECQPDQLYENMEPYTLYANTEFAITDKKEKQSNTKPKYFEDEPVDFEESVYANA
ncbi:sialic acid-binding Ig-like lectin 14 [Rana temporaria]|uniref:sialic acid-binding Ig-like lectin 14 n=1 Tax=Rana temporaria TaxID=8407 RepID=UPI001AAD9B2A|nr:sialic acid-binding Ig-like lectin 14 [Rana temporaria]